MLRYTDEQLKELGPTAAATHVASGADYEETLETGTLFCDTAEHMVELLKGIEEKYPGLEHFVMMYPIGETRVV